jgi:cap2 methyltransferase
MTTKNNKLISLELDFDKYKVLEYGSVGKPNIVHDGQRKLLISEMHFLNHYYNEKYTVVYVGAGPGHHIPLLAEFYPNFTFILYDKTKFAFEATPRLIQRNYYFSEKEAEKIKKEFKTMLFMSDIRNLEISKYKNEGDLDINDSIILEDLEKQGKWVEIMEPKASLIKFRLPYKYKTPTKFYDGLNYLQPWSPVSTESRLWITDLTKFKLYDNQEIDGKMYYYNSEIRPKSYSNYAELIEKDIKLPNNIDITAELMILEEYKKVSKEKKTIVELHFHITKELGKIMNIKIKYIDIKKSFSNLKPKFIRDLMKESKSSDELLKALFILRKNYTKPKKIESEIDELLYFNLN